MDERTRRPGDETAPDVHPTVPAPVIEPRPGGRRRLVIGLIVLIGILLVGYLIYRSVGAAPPGAAAQSAAGRATGRRRHRRHRRHPRHRQCTRHGHADRDGHRANADRRPASASCVYRRATGQAGRFSGADRPAAVSATASAIRRPVGARSGPARAGAGRPAALPKTRRTEFDRPPAIRGSSLHRATRSRHGETRSGAGRSAEAQRHLLPHRFAGHRTDRATPGRSGKLRANRLQHRSRRRYPDAADHRDLSDSGRRLAGYPADAQLRRHFPGDGL